LEPAGRDHAPTIARPKPGEAILGSRRDQVVADLLLVGEERGSDHGAHGVATGILRSGTAAPVAVEAGQGVVATSLQMAVQDVLIDRHRFSFAPGDRTGYSTASIPMVIERLMALSLKLREDRRFAIAAAAALPLLASAVLSTVRGRVATATAALVLVLAVVARLHRATG